MVMTAAQHNPNIIPRQTRDGDEDNNENTNTDIILTGTTQKKKMEEMKRRGMQSL